MIVTIDGPAGAGKSTVARALARRLGFRFLDTGATYRAVALAAIRRKLDWDDPEALVGLARQLRITLEPDRVLLDGEDVTHAIRTTDVTVATHYAANNAGVREHLVKFQQATAGTDDIVTEGRDQGTVVFPQAECKFYLTASPEERARRRAEQLASRGETSQLSEVLKQQNQRDKRDMSRAVGPLTPAAEAIEVVTDGLTPDEVVLRMELLVRQRL